MEISNLKGFISKFLTKVKKKYIYMRIFYIYLTIQIDFYRKTIFIVNISIIFCNFAYFLYKVQNIVN